MKGLQHIENSLSNVIQGCKEWLYKNWMVNLKNVYREGNQVANHLAKMALKHHHNNFIKWRIPPSGVANLILKDKLDTVSSRRVLNCT